MPAVFAKEGSDDLGTQGAFVDACEYLFHGVRLTGSKSANEMLTLARSLRTLHFHACDLFESQMDIDRLDPEKHIANCLMMSAVDSILTANRRIIDLPRQVTITSLSC